MKASKARRAWRCSCYLWYVS